MKKTLAFAAFALTSIAYAASNNYNVTLYSPTSVNGTDLQPGSVKVHVEGDKASLKQGKTTVEVPVHVETKSNKFLSTTVDTSEGKIQEIRLGGTSTVLVFGPSAEKAALANGSK